MILDYHCVWNNFSKWCRSRSFLHVLTLPSLSPPSTATLTSYSAESAAGRDESAKYPCDGYGSSRQKGSRLVVPSTSSSCVVGAGRSSEGFLYRAEGDMAASTYSLNKLHPDRGTGSSHSPGSTHSIPLYLMPRPNSVAGRKESAVWKI